MTRSPDMLRFLGGVVPKHECGWAGPWPPPSRLGLAVGHESGMRTVFDPDETHLDLLRSVDSIDFAVYELRNASQLPDDFESEHVFRGAEYVPEAVTA